MATSSCQRISTKPTTISALSEERVDVSLPRSEKTSHEISLISSVSWCCTSKNN